MLLKQLSDGISLGSRLGSPSLSSRPVLHPRWAWLEHKLHRGDMKVRRTLELRFPYPSSSSMSFSCLAY